MLVAEPTTCDRAIAVTSSDTLVTVQAHTLDEGNAYENLYVYASANPLAFLDPLGLWGAEIHYGGEAYGGTLQCAKDEGLTPLAAKIVAWADNSVDSLWRGKSFLPGVGDQSRHFNTDPNAVSGSIADSRILHAEQSLQRAVELGQSANRLSQGNIFQRAIAPIQEWRSLTALGTGLHSLQDLDAHADQFVKSFGGVYYHSTESPADRPGRPDNPNQRFINTREATTQYIQTYRNAVTGGVKPPK